MKGEGRGGEGVKLTPSPDETTLKKPSLIRVNVKVLYYVIFEWAHGDGKE